MTGEPITIERRPRTYVTVGAVALIVAGVAVGAYVYTRHAATPPPTGVIGAAPATHTVTGTLQLDGVVGPKWETGTYCFGTGGYKDILEGAQIVVTDPAGATIALGSLGGGVVTPKPEADGSKTCVFAIRVTGVPLGLSSYGIEVSRRGKLQFREADLDRPVELKLG